jgi:hypothetical protein
VEGLERADRKDSDHAWDEFKAEYSGSVFATLISYIEKEWLNPATKERILGCHSNKNFHVGMWTTSCGEGSHASLKADPGTSTADHV